MPTDKAFDWPGWLATVGAMTLRGWVLLTGLAIPTLADDVALVRVGETWRFFKGVAEASAPATAWRQPGFDDSQWPEGRAGFTSSSYGYEATDLPDMPSNYLSVYLRKRFALDDRAKVKWLVLRVDYDDGFVAYLNGTEIARRGLPGEPGVPVPTTRRRWSILRAGQRRST